MSTLLERVQQTVAEQSLVQAGDVLVAAVSGGADSTAQACLLAELAPRLGAQLIGLAHLNHQLREAADTDEAFCRDLAGRLGVAFDTRRVDVRSEARVRKTSIEDAARTVRYLFLNEVAADRGATLVAVGHTRDDQAETVLLRLIRGAGPAGLAAIYPRVGRVIRPLLDARRTDVVAWLRERGQPWREDESNQDRTIPRNKVRHELLPWLVEGFGAGVVDVLARQATLSRDDADWFDMVATETAARLVIEDGASVTVEQAALSSLHPAVGRRVVLDALRRAANGRFVGFDHVEAVLALPAGGGVDLPGQRVECRQGRLRFAAKAPDPAREGRRRGRPASAGRDDEEAIGASMVSKAEGDRPGGDHRPDVGPEVEHRVELEPQANGGPRRARSVSLEGHAPKGGRG
ncbi:MAG: tRNA lysidine(34) synthetase TilS [Vicinamibacteraceae bacterium]